MEPSDGDLKNLYEALWKCGDKQKQTPSGGKPYTILESLFDEYDYVDGTTLGYIYMYIIVGQHYAHEFPSKCPNYCVAETEAFINVPIHLHCATCKINVFWRFSNIQNTMQVYAAFINASFLATHQLDVKPKTIIINALEICVMFWTSCNTERR